MLEYIISLAVIGVATIAVSIHYMRKVGFDIFSIHK
jgi:hypothetical protein